MSTSNLKPWIVDDLGAEPFLVWAKTAASAKAIARKEYAPRTPETYWEKEKIDPNWDAEVYRIPLEAEPPSKPGLETREEVLEAAAKHVRWEDR